MLVDNGLVTLYDDGPEDLFACYCPMTFGSAGHLFLRIICPVWLRDDRECWTTTPDLTLTFSLSGWLA